MTTTTATPTEHPLWTRARAMFARAAAAVGGPAAVAAIKLISKEMRRDIIAWICPLEHVVRKLLFAEACEIQRAERLDAHRGPRLVHVPLRSPGWTAGLPARTGAVAAEECAAGAARSKSSTRRSKIDLSRPETWRAPFSFALPCDPHRVPDARAPRIRALWGPAPPPPPPPAQRAPRVLDEAAAPFRLARRLEALRRVLENPLPHARRLAEALIRTVRKQPDVVRRYVLAPARTCDYDRKDDRLGVEATGAALARWGVFENSS